MHDQDCFSKRAIINRAIIGGAIEIPQLGKYWLSCLNLYKWEGVIPVPTELWYAAERQSYPRVR